MKEAAMNQTVSDAVMNVARRFVERTHPSWLSITLRDPGTGSIASYQTGSVEPAPRRDAFLSRPIVTEGTRQGRVELGMKPRELARLMAQGGLDEIMSELARLYARAAQPTVSNKLELR